MTDTQRTPVHIYMVGHTADPRQIVATLSDGALLVKAGSPIRPEDVVGNGRLLRSAFNSYGKLPNAIEAAKEDLLGDALGLVYEAIGYSFDWEESGEGPEDFRTRCRAVLCKSGADYG